MTDIEKFCEKYGVNTSEFEPNAPVNREEELAERVRELEAALDVLLEGKTE